MCPPYYSLDTLHAGNSLGYLIKRCGILLTQIAERGFEAQPLSFTQWVVLAQLSQRAHMTPTELRKHIGFDLGTLTRIVDDLVGKGLVGRERSETDRRAVRITITAEGRQLAKAGMPKVVQLNNGLVEPFSKSETDSLISLLQRLLAHMESNVGESVEESRTPVLAKRSASRSRN
jgi:DNA-binding MarR family transcriptional regulator